MCEVVVPNPRLVKGVEELVAEFTEFNATQGYMSCVIAILYFGTIYLLEAVGQSTLFRPWFRGILADYAYPVRLLPLI
jgi:boron transporter